MPSYLPDGYALQKVGLLFDGKEVSLTYRAPAGGTLQVAQGGGVIPGGAHVKEGFSEQVSIGANTGYLVRGAWVQMIGGPFEGSRLRAYLGTERTGAASVRA